MDAAAQPPPHDTRSHQVAAIRRTVERVAPSIDQTRILSAGEIEQLKQADVTRDADRRYAQQIGRKGLIERLKKTVERATTPAEPIKLPTEDELCAADGFNVQTSAQGDPAEAETKRFPRGIPLKRPDE